MLSEIDRDNLRAAMPEVLGMRCGISDLRRAFRCPAPDHDDRTPSAKYYENNHTVHCYGCGRTWDAFTLVGMLDGIEGFTDQARAVADLIGYHIGEDQAPRVPRRPQRVRRPDPYDKPRDAGAQDASEECSRAFGALYEPGNEVGRRYLRWRGLDDDDIMRHGLGFCRDPRDVMSQFSVYEPEAIGFIVIPFWSEGFERATYCMVRTISRGHVNNKEWRPKGVVSPLWNEWMLSAALPVVYVAEGLIDAMALTKLLGKPVMALGGVANSKRFSEVLYHTPAERRPGNLVVCMDEDDEGRKCSRRICTDLALMRMPYSILPSYPGGAKDADEWLMAGRGSEWDFEERESVTGGPALYYTRWRDGQA